MKKLQAKKLYSTEAIITEIIAVNLIIKKTIKRTKRGKKNAKTEA